MAARREFLFVCLLSFMAHTISKEDYCKCCETGLQIGQYFCVSPKIDLDTQSECDCDPYTRMTNVTCYPIPKVKCNNTEVSNSSFFYRQSRCRYVTGQRYNYYVAISLSLFLGIFGIDRFYLGYPAIGLIKLCTAGFFFIGYVIDFVLITTQIVGPADQSDYYTPFYGPALYRLTPGNLNQ